MKANKLNLQKELINVKENAVLTIKQVAQKIQVSLPWLYRKTKRGEIPYIRIDGLLRFREQDIDKWLDSQRVKAHKRQT